MTAQGVALLRAAHLLLDGEPKILLDTPVLRMLGPAVDEHVRTYADKYQSPGARALRVHVVLRSRFAEDRLADAVRRGIRQYVILGAGGDTFGYRQPEWASGIRIFEVDQPASQAVKRRQLAHGGIEIPSNVAFAAVDFEHTSLREGLMANGVDLDAPIFVSWLGVTMYLTETAVDAVFKTVAGFAPTSELVFTYARAKPEESSDYGQHDGPTLAERAAALGEPWLTYFEPAELDARLRGFGFSDVYFLTPAVARDLYFRARSDDLPVPRRTSIVSAIV